MVGGYYRIQIYLSVLVLSICLLFSVDVFSQQVRIKDITNIRGYRENQLIGFGLIIGLSGTGDSAKSVASTQALSNLMTKMGIKIDSNQVITQSIAAVIVTANLMVFKRIGDKIDVKVSTIGDAKSLAGGTLLFTPLKAADGQIYAVAQGSVVMSEAKGSGTQVLTTAIIPNGGIVEKEFKPTIVSDGILTLTLNYPDFTTSSRIAEAINKHFQGFYAKSQDPSSVYVEIPILYNDNLIDFIAEMENISVITDQKAVIVINERTGTVVMGADVVVSSVSISHGDLSIKIGDNNNSKSKNNINQNVVNIHTTTIGKLVDTLNALGVKPQDLVGIIQSIHAAGAIHADLKIL